jgi:hypothetical protein
MRRRGRPPRPETDRPRREPVLRRRAPEAAGDERPPDIGGQADRRTTESILVEDPVLRVDRTATVVVGSHNRAIGEPLVGIEAERGHARELEAERARGLGVASCACASGSTQRRRERNRPGSEMPESHGMVRDGARVGSVGPPFRESERIHSDATRMGFASR